MKFIILKALSNIKEFVKALLRRILPSVCRWAGVPQTVIRGRDVYVYKSTFNIIEGDAYVDNVDAMNTINGEYL
ncbi:hypothetical protein GALMADRAFT_148367 [Galerina marginata CBS 339.88]|uniref:Uncharacterized protein n=1 Tax=Galerina marginata (strain CBS 339.88) TaxID=685588 RepID=A0A067SDR2_GALM3|nr:hypothetical protein GALMADRAFT_148367 [Galerina marginata CBS 339.88]